MKTNKDYMLREIAGESLLIPTGTASQKLNGMIRLTETAVFIWKQVDTAADLAEIVRRIREEFDVDQETAQRDVHGFLREFYLLDMVRDIPELEEELAKEREEEQ